MQSNYLKLCISSIGSVSSNILGSDDSEAVKVAEDEESLVSVEDEEGEKSLDIHSVCSKPVLKKINISIHKKFSMTQ